MQAALNEAVATLLPILVSLLVTVATLAMHKLRQKLEGQVSQDLLDRAWDVSELTVLQVEKTVVRELKEYAEDGELSKQDILEVRAEAYKTFSELMGSKSMKALNAQATDHVETLVHRFVDAQLQERKEIDAS